MRRMARTGSTLLLALGVLAGLGLVVPAMLGYQRYVIVSGSMTGSYDRGSLVFDDVVPTRDLKVGDVITYTPPPGSGPTGLVTHRIAAITRDAQGTRYRTKGDANAAADPWSFTLRDERQARAVASVPWAGYALSALSDRRVRLLVVGVPALLIAITALGGLWRESGAAPERSPA